MKRISPRGRAITVNLSDVPAKEVRWLWPGYLPIGKLTLLDGDPDMGKSMLTLDLAASVTTGRGFPDGTACEVGGVVILTAEDDLEDTIRPRLDAAGADPSRVACLSGVRVGSGQAVSPSLSDLDALEEAVKQVRAKLVIVDTLADFFGVGSLVNPQAVRGVLLPLVALAKKLDFAVILIRHFTKSGKTLMSKGAGSTAIAAVSRSGLFVVRDPGDRSRRILSSYKSNLCPTEPQALAYHFISEKGTGRVAWDGASRWTAQALFAASLENETAKTARKQAQEFLLKALDDGPLPASEVQDAGKAEGIASRTLERARRDLGVTSERRGGRKGVWYLHLVESTQREKTESPLPATSPDGVRLGPRDATQPDIRGFHHSEIGGLYGAGLTPPTLPSPPPAI